MKITYTPCASNKPSLLVRSLLLGWLSVWLSLSTSTNASEPTTSLSPSQQLDNAVNNISDLRWRNRLLLISLSAGNDLQQKWIKELSVQQHAILERRLLVALVARSSVMYFPQSSVNVTNTFDAEVIKLLAQEKAQHADEVNVLIGLDGFTKRRYRADQFTLKVVFTDIDSMPMRQSELRKN